MHRVVRILPLLGCGLMLALSLHTPALAKDLYVSPNGDDTDTGSESAPFSSIGRALQKARSGDTVYVAHGVYRESCLMPRAGVSLVGLNGQDEAGRSGKPKVIGPTEQRGQCTEWSDHWPHPILNIEKTKDVVIDNFELEGGFVAAVMVGYNKPADRITVRNCIIHGVRTDDNGAAIFLESGSGHVIENNKLYDIDSGNKATSAGVISFSRVGEYSVIGNEIWDTHKGVYDKHGNADGPARTVLYNDFHDLKSWGVSVNTSGTLVSENRFARMGYVAIKIGDGSGKFCQPTGVIVERNTVDGGYGQAVDNRPNSECKPPRRYVQRGNSWQLGDGADDCWVGVNAPCRTGEGRPQIAITRPHKREGPDDAAVTEARQQLEESTAICTEETQATVLWVLDAKTIDLLVEPETGAFREQRVQLAHIAVAAHGTPEGERALKALRRRLKIGNTVTVCITDQIGDHGEALVSLFDERGRIGPWMIESGFATAAP